MKGDGGALLLIVVSVHTDSDDELTLLPIARKDRAATPTGRAPARQPKNRDARATPSHFSQVSTPSQTATGTTLPPAEEADAASSQARERSQSSSVTTVAPSVEVPTTPRRSARLLTPAPEREGSPGLAPESPRITPGKRARSKAPEEDSVSAAAPSTPKRRRPRLASEEPSRHRVHHHHNQHRHASPGVATRSAREGSQAPVTRSHCELVKLELRSNATDGAPYHFCIPGVSKVLRRY